MEPKWSSRERGREKYIYLPTKYTTYFTLTGKTLCALCKNSWTWYIIVYNTAVEMMEHTDNLMQKIHKSIVLTMELCLFHDDIMKWKHILCYWSFVWGINWSPVNSPHKGQWHRTLMFSLICTWTNVCANNRDASDLRHHRAHYDVTIMFNQAIKMSYIELTKTAHAPW